MRLMKILGFVWLVRSSRLTISADQMEKLAGSIRWLIGTLSRLAPGRRPYAR